MSYQTLNVAHKQAHIVRRSGAHRRLEGLRRRHLLGRTVLFLVAGLGHRPEVTSLKQVTSERLWEGLRLVEPLDELISRVRSQRLLNRN